MNEIENTFIDQIIDRATDIFGKKINRLSLHMDLIACHKQNYPLDFEKLANTSSFNFSHDIAGIINNMNRTTGKIENCFVPRCTKK